MKESKDLLHYTMKIRSFIIIAFSIALFVNVSAQGFRPVNPNASAEAKQLLEFLYSIQGKYCLTGQHNFVSDLKRYDDVAFKITGKYPVVWGSDFSFNALGDSARRFQGCGPMNLTVPFDEFAFNGRSTDDLRQNMINEAINKYNEGRIITLMWHCCFPTDGDDCSGNSIWTWDRRPSMEKWNELVTDGTPLNKAWKKQMDGIAKYLKQLQDARIPVLWRPFHEMNGVWFWWCDKPGEWGFKRLWIAMYDYFTNHHKLNNLIWVWNTNAPRDIPGDEAGPYRYFYPGTEYVDILAADVYRHDYKQSHHDDIFKLSGGKLIALGEIGDMPTLQEYQKQPNWSWFMSWGYALTRWMTEDDVRAVYNHSRSITLDEIDFSGKTYKLKQK